MQASNVTFLIIAIINFILIWGKVFMYFYWYIGSDSLGALVTMLTGLNAGNVQETANKLAGWVRVQI